MKPIKFSEQNCIYAKDQPQYLPLPVYKFKDGTVVSCWKLNILERVYLLFTGRLWLSILTFNQSLQPQLLQIKKPIFKEIESND